MLITYFRIHIILMFFITFSNSQSFDIYDSSIKLTDHNYNLTKDSSLTALYQYPKSVKLENKTNIGKDRAVISIVSLTFNFLSFFLNASNKLVPTKRVKKEQNKNKA